MWLACCWGIYQVFVYFNALAILQLATILKLKLIQTPILSQVMALLLLQVKLITYCLTFWITY